MSATPVQTVFLPPIHDSYPLVVRDEAAEMRATALRMWAWADQAASQSRHVAARMWQSAAADKERETDALLIRANGRSVIPEPPQNASPVLAILARHGRVGRA